jgi:hypothetical protein
MGAHSAHGITPQWRPRPRGVINILLSLGYAPAQGLSFRRGRDPEHDGEHLSAAAIDAQRIIIASFQRR